MSICWLVCRPVERCFLTLDKWKQATAPPHPRVDVHLTSCTDLALFYRLFVFLFFSALGFPSSFSTSRASSGEFERSPSPMCTPTTTPHQPPQSPPRQNQAFHSHLSLSLPHFHSLSLYPSVFWERNDAVPSHRRSLWKNERVHACPPSSSCQ